jgi:hypothetical protein
MMLAKMLGFLQFLLEARSELRQAWNDYIRRGTHPGRPIVDFNDRGVVFALPVRGADGRDYDLELRPSGLRMAGRLLLAFTSMSKPAKRKSGSFPIATRKISRAALSTRARLSEI